MNIPTEHLVQTNVDLNTRLKALPDVLQKLGFKELRKPQIKPIYNALNDKDQIVVLPTGGGKSLCYILPASCSGYKTLVFFPLVALIKDQLESLLRKGLKAGAVCSLFSAAENRKTLHQWTIGEIQFLLIAPERLKNEEFKVAIKTTLPQMIVVDEIHVASEHSFNFRPDYRKIAGFVQELKPNVFLGLTATLPKEVESDLKKIFDMPDIECVVDYYNRENLIYDTVYDATNFNLLKQLNKIEGPCIVYFSTIKRLTETFDALRSRVTGGVLVYHGSLSPKVKESNQNAFMQENVRVMFATVSFGMGVDKQNISGIIYRDIPGSIEELSQGFGRGGRDGNKCECQLFWDEQTLSTQLFFIDIGYPPKQIIEKLYSGIKAKADSAGMCNVPLTQICKQVGIQSFFAGAASSILQSNEVITKATKLHPLKIKPLLKTTSGTLNSIFEYILDVGWKDPADGFYAIDRELLCEDIAVDDKKLTTTLLAGVKRKECEVINAMPVKGYKIQKQNLQDFNWSDLLERRQKAYKRLESVKTYANLASHRTRQQFFQDYFLTQDV